MGELTRGASLIQLGVDVGSTTVKVAALDAQSGDLLCSRYVRHNARQTETVHALLQELFPRFPDAAFRIAVCGSGGKTIAELIHAPYIQEVVANAIAVRKRFPHARVAVELGGQDAKIIFFYHDEATGRLLASDMRMNGSCAGGTGAFIDEVAHLLKTPVEEFEALAAAGTHVYDISGRCGVFAKTDIQPLLNQGCRREDIALSTFHAIVKQTIGGLAQGLEFKPPIIFEGGPLTFNPTLIRVFAERLNLREADIIRPQQAETIVALGAACSLDELFAEAAPHNPAETLAALAAYREKLAVNDAPQCRFFDSADERRAFDERHRVPPPPPAICAGETLRAYLGVDSGSTTTKFVLLAEDERVADSFYAANHGEPLTVLQQALVELDEKYRRDGVTLEIVAAGSTGYGEMLVAQALGADYHTVETVCHAAAALKYAPGASFILDIGGQDMKAISIVRDVVTGITLNEACSAGCGSFLENFAQSLAIPVEEIAAAAFNARNPAVLGSRCTVFMNSCIITEQKNGKWGDDLMAGLCRSIIENVFTKVVRLSNFSALGDTIIAQGGTFKNDAVLRALEQYTGKTIVRAPYPGEMGAIGVALLTKKRVEALRRSGVGFVSRFIGLSSIKELSWRQRSDYTCGFCANHCRRTLITFSTGEGYVTGNRCERGEVIGADDDAGVRERVQRVSAKIRAVPDLMNTRAELLFRPRDTTPVSPPKHIVIGLPRSLEFWDSMPFWTSFFHALGFETRLSRASNRALFEQGLPFVSSDTVCFPAKLVHGHIRDLKEQGVDRIFMPMIIRMPSENADPLSDYVCAVVKGYPLVVKHSDDPARRWNIPFDTPMFHWFKPADRNRQLCDWCAATFGLTPDVVTQAIRQGERALKAFRDELLAEGQRVLNDVRERGTFAVVLAGRPYHNDELVSHDLARAFTRLDIPVLTADALPGVHEVDLARARVEITNNFHTRMLAGAVLAAQRSELEYVQIVSFGCGHDAILTDEIIRLMKEISDKAPLILKLDEGDAVGPLNLRIKSFVETIKTRRERAAAPIRPLPDPFPAKFTRADWHNKTILIPNVSVSFCKLATAAIQRQGFKVAPLPLGGLEAIRLGKKYVHNDICFPAQMNIGEALSVLQNGQYKPDEVVIGLAKYQCDCRLSHYAALARRAFDEAGYAEVPIITTDKIDSKNMYPGAKLGALFELRMLWGVTIMDILEELRRKIRPYEQHAGETDRRFDEAMDSVAHELSRGVRFAIAAFDRTIDVFCALRYDRAVVKPPVFITGEYLLNYHPGSNFRIEEYLEKNGMEVILPRMLNVYHRDYVRKLSEMRDFHVSYPFAETLLSYVGAGLFDHALDKLEKIADRHPLYERCTRAPALAAVSDSVMHRTFTSGEGWLIPAEILHHAAHGVRSFVILQPFGCLPNHICGRGVIKRLKEDFPHIQILPLDYDPDTSFANIENRLQMLIMNQSA
ncbi:MAG: acyl-CoA dehydratase activase [Treponema sp.]|jgi:predicted CoA-substrate-specific enzyme activase|nr:acyl-CoA dehydratase activase [Treponema sp.]